MSENTKAIKLKIDHYCQSEGLTATAFADKLGLSKQALHNMLSGQQNFTAAFFVGIMQKTDIDIYKLFDDDSHNVNLVREDREEYGDKEGGAKYRKALKEIQEILQKTQI